MDIDLKQYVNTTFTSIYNTIGEINKKDDLIKEIEKLKLENKKLSKNLQDSIANRYELNKELEEAKQDLALCKIIIEEQGLHCDGFVSV